MKPAPDRARLIRWLITLVVVANWAVTAQLVLRVTGEWLDGVGSVAAGLTALLSVPALAVVACLLVRAW